MENRTFSNTNQGNIFISNAPVNQVYKTEDYSIFQFSKFNRNVIESKEMLEQAKDGFVAPIIVNENMVVIDGQHRLKHAEKAGVPVEFIIKKGLSEHDIVRMNTVQKKWSLLNHIEAHANEGLEEYIKLINLLNNKNYTGNITAVTTVATFEMDSQRARPKIIGGNFKFRNFDITVKFLEYLAFFKEKTKLSYKTKLTLAIFELFQIKKIDTNRLISKVISTGLADDLQTKTLDLTDAKKQLIDAYNHGLGEESVRLIDYSIKPNGHLVINEEKADWAKVDLEN